MLRAGLRIGLLCLLLVQGAVADELKNALAVLERGDYAQAYTLLQPMAQAGDAEAQYQLGELLALFPQPGHPASEGRQWLEEAVVQQHYRAAISLSKMYLSGTGVEPDMQKGRYYLELAESFPDAPDEECD